MLNPSQPLLYLLVYLVLLYVRPHEYIPGLIGLPLLPIFLVLAIVLWAARATKNFTAPQFKLIPVQTVIMSFSVLLSGWLGGAITTFTEFMPVVVLFFMLATTLDSVRKFKYVFFTLGACMIDIALHSIQQAQPESGGVGWTGAQMVDERITYLGFLNDPNDLSMAFLMVLPMVMYMARHSGKLLRLVWWAGAFAILFAVKLANSRGAVLALGAIFFQYGIFRYGLWRSLLVGPVMALPIVIFGPSRMNEMSADEESAEGRIDAWYEGFNMLIHHPLFGVGKGQFIDHNFLTAHNSYVLALAELGFIGYFVWLSNIVISWLMLASVEGQGACDPAGVAATSGAASKGQTEQGESWADVHECARTVWYGFTAALVAMFFLSRSYVTILYVHMALIVAVFQMAGARCPAIPSITWSERWGRLLGFAFAVAIGLWVVTMVLMRMK